MMYLKLGGILMSKVMISTDALRTHAKKVKIFETKIDDMNSKLTAMTNQLNSAWVDTNCTAFCNTVQDLQRNQIKSFRENLVSLQTYMESRATAYETAFNKIKSAQK